MYEYTTPTIPCTLEGVDFSQVDFIRLAFEGKTKLVKQVAIDDIDTEAGTFSVKLTQEETANIGVGAMDIQARIHYTDGTVEATAKIPAKMEEVIDKVVI